MYWYSSRCSPLWGNHVAPRTELFALEAIRPPRESFGSLRREKWESLLGAFPIFFARSKCYRNVVLFLRDLATSGKRQELWLCQHLHPGWRHRIAGLRSEGEGRSRRESQPIRGILREGMEGEEKRVPPGDRNRLGMMT